ncbi:MAG: PorT family protein [Dysgonamonadaceae bacterium]|jgi:hypothetical protein|nr:PorT family protein [Dysgonamonadaceae bacterium]
MKKSILLILGVLFLSSLTAQAQFKFGLKAGLNLSNVSFSGDISDNLDTKNFTGFQVGPMAEFTVPIIGVGFDAAVLYSQQGFKIEGIKDSYRLNTLEIPVNFKYKVTVLDVVGGYLALGPYASFNLSDKLRDQYDSKSFGAGLNFGLGVEFLSKLQIGVNYKLGLTNDLNSLITNPGGDVLKGEGKQRGWTVSATYFL